MKRSTRSLLEELNSVYQRKNSEELIESRATHVINSAINLIKLIKESYPADQAYELERRFLNSIKGEDANKFIRGIRRVRDAKDTVKTLKIIDGNLKKDDF